MGLFLRRRPRMSIIWRISLSRPRTGSMRPARASALKFTQNRVSALSAAAPSDCPAPAASPDSGRTSSRRRRSSDSPPRFRRTAVSSSTKRSGRPATAAHRPAVPIDSRRCSIDTMSHASISNSTRNGENTGRPLLPRARDLRLRSRHCGSRAQSTSNMPTIARSSSSGLSSMVRRACSMATS